MTSLLAVLISLTVACGDSPTKPTAVTPTALAGTVDPAAGPVARLAIAADQLGSRDAIAAVSQVNVNAAASSGTSALTYAIDFGDGATTTNPTATHVYQTPGTFPITAVVRDAAGRTANASGAITVKTLTGSWFYAAYEPRAHKFERRFLTISDQAGPVVRGTYSLTSTPDRGFSATLASPRTLHIVLDDHSAELEGVVPGALNEDNGLWTFQMRGESVDGQRLAFRPVIGQPSGPPPDAVLRIRNDSFGDAFIIQGLSLVQFDGSTSRGDGLAYVIEFGDGEVSTQPTATHRFDQAQLVSAQMTVVDRFGRTDTEAATLGVDSLVNHNGDTWIGGPPFRQIEFVTRDGLTLRGSYRGDTYANFVATLSGERDIRMVLEDASGIVLEGHFELRDPSQDLWTLILRQSGGARDGSIYTLIFHSYS